MKRVSGTVKLAKISVAMDVIGPRAETTKQTQFLNAFYILIFIPIDLHSSQHSSEKLLAMESSWYSLPKGRDWKGLQTKKDNCISPSHPRNQVTSGRSYQRLWKAEVRENWYECLLDMTRPFHSWNSAAVVVFTRHKKVILKKEKEKIKRPSQSKVHHEWARAHREPH